MPKTKTTERSEEAVQGDGDGQDPAPADDAQPQPGAQVVEEEAEVRHVTSRSRRATTRR